MTTLEKTCEINQKIDQTLTLRGEQKIQEEYDVLNKVIMKHHQKQQSLKKVEKEKKANMRAEVEKRMEQEILHKNNLESIRREQIDRQMALQEKLES